MKNRQPILKLLVLALIVFLNACNMSDDVTNLPGGYQLVSEAKNSNSIIGSQNIAPNVVAYCYNSDFILAEQKLEDATFIAKEGERLLTIFENFQSNGYEKLDGINSDSVAIYKLFINKGANINERSSHKNVVIAYKIADSIVHSSSFQKEYNFEQTHYYIIRIVNNRLIGPMTKEEYLQKRKTLDIPENLKMQPAYN